MQMTTLLETPERLVQNGQIVSYGLFKEPFHDLNILDTQIFPGKTLPQFLRKLRIKEWQHIAVITPDVFVGFVISTTHYMGMSFCYVVDRHSGEIVEHHRETAPWKAKVSRELWQDDCRFHVSGYNLDIRNRLELGRHRVEIDIPAAKGKPAIRAEIEMSEDITSRQPLIVVLPISENRPLHTHKMVCPVSGWVELGERRWDLQPERDLAMLDVQKTYYPYSTLWCWATFAGYDQQGHQLAINLVQNMIENDDTYNENVMWVDGQLSQFGGARFTVDKQKMMDPWHIITTDERCQLTFTPQGSRSEKINMGLILSDYHQPYGTFTGHIIDDDGVRYEVEDLFGVTEYHIAKF